MKNELKVEARKRREGPSRRQVLAGAAAGGLVFQFNFPLISRIGTAVAAPTQTQVSAWIAIGTDESITVQVGSAEMGQGILSGAAQIVAEELMVNWTKVQAQHSPANAVYNNPLTNSLITGGSSSVRGYFQPMRIAGATVREMLKKAAANKFSVPVSQCVAAQGVVTVTGTSNSATYGQLAPAAALLTPPTNPPLLGTGQILGQPLPRLDIPAKVTGAAIFGIDVRIPGMVYAAVQHSPIVGGTLVGTPKKPQGALAVVPLGNAVAVVANDTWSAIQAARSLQAQWSNPTTPVDSTAILAQAQQLMTSGTPAVAEQAGNVATAMANAAKTLTLFYQVPYLAHACMEVLNCTVSVTPTTCEIWAPTQARDLCVYTAAAITGLPASSITVHTTFLGGGLGRKFEQDYIAQAVQVAKAVGKPVHLTWSREEDFGNDQYRPFALVRVQVGLDKSGNIVAWANRIVSPSILYQRGWIGPNDVDSQGVDGAIGLTYAFQNRLVEYIQLPAAVPVGFWRSVGHSINAFVVESAIDEIATALNVDPLAYRLKLLANDPASRAVLNAAANLAGWSKTPPKGHARGIALSVGFGSIVAQVAEVSKTGKSQMTVNKISCAIDVGTIVNPDSIAAQMEGGIVHGLTAALWGQIQFTAGAVSARNFNNYRMMRMRDMPTIAVQPIASGAPIGGVGEPGVPGVAPALANAWAKLTGSRLRTLPLFPQAPGAGGGDD